MKKSSEYRKEAKNALKGNWFMAICITVIIGIAYSVLSFSVLGVLLLSGAVEIGYCFANLMLYRRGKFRFVDLFEAFKFNDNFSAVAGVGIKHGFYVFFWSLLFVIPGIVKAYAYSMSEYIFADNPDITGGEAITLSRNLMKGKKFKLFCLDLSFIGWIILAILTLGILFIWIAPWMKASKAAFYESIKDEVDLSTIGK